MTAASVILMQGRSQAQWTLQAAMVRTPRILANALAHNDDEQTCPALHWGRLFQDGRALLRFVRPVGATIVSRFYDRLF